MSKNCGIQIGDVFGRLTIIECVGSKNNRRVFKCQCECGKVCYCNGNKLKTGNTKSCGCLKHPHYIDGVSHKIIRALLVIYKNMWHRCYDVKNENSVRHYYNKGITICDEWLNDKMSFVNWALQNGYSIGLSIDRIDSNGNYEPSNCQWLTRSENSRRASQILIEVDGIYNNITQWSKILHCSPSTLSQKIKHGQQEIENFIRERLAKN